MDDEVWTDRDTQESIAHAGLGVTQSREARKDEPRSEPIAGYCIDIGGQWWAGHGPGSGCHHCDPSDPAVPRSDEPREQPELSSETYEVLRRILDEPPFGHHIKGNPDEGEWRCTNDDETEWESAEEHLARVVFVGAFPFAASIPSPSSEDGLRAELVELQAALDAEMASVTPDYKGVARLAIAVLKRALSTPPSPAPESVRARIEALPRYAPAPSNGWPPMQETPGGGWIVRNDVLAALATPTDPKAIR